MNGVTEKLLRTIRELKERNAELEEENRKLKSKLECRS